MKTSKTFIYIAILSVVVIVLIYLNRPPSVEGTQNSRVEDSLRAVIKSYESKQKNYDSTLVLLNNSIDSINNLLEQNRKDLIKIKNKLHENNTAISKFTSNDIYKYLSNRYPSRDSTKNR